MKALHALKQRLESFREKLPNRDQQHWDLNSAHAHLHWTVDECLILDSHRCQKTLCVAQIEGLGEAYQTLILDCDLDSNSLLVDRFFPELPLQILYTKQFARLRLVTAKSVLCLRIQFLHEELYGRDFALRARICSKQLSSDRRVHPRIEFDRESGPTARLISPLGADIRGRIVNLSSGGLLLKSCAQSTPSFYTSRGECQIQLHQQHQLKLPVIIKNHRRPKHSKHQLLVTLIFDRIQSDEEDKIRAFIAAIEEARKHLVASGD